METDTGRRPIVRELALTRRRSRLPWVYLVYRVRRRGRAENAREDAGAGGPAKGGSARYGDSVLSTQEGGDVERRIELERMLP